MVFSEKRIEQTHIQFVLPDSLSLLHARWLRGAIARLIDRPEFHHHVGKQVVYEHPLIRYSTSGSTASVVGLAEGAFLLRRLPPLESLLLGSQEYRVLKHNVEANRIVVGSTDDLISYRFQSPYLPLNQDNYSRWAGSNASQQRQLLQKIVVGNVLSMCKAIGLHISERLSAEVNLVEDDWYELKPKVRLLGFTGSIKVNFQFPDGWGIGKSSARGFGTIMREEV